AIAYAPVAERSRCQCTGWRTANRGRRTMIHRSDTRFFRRPIGADAPALARRRKERTAFVALVATQVLGTLNENFYRMIVALIAVDVSFSVGGSQYLSLTGIIFVLPFELSSGYAGQVADRFDRRAAVIVTRTLDILASFLGLVAIVLGHIE